MWKLRRRDITYFNQSHMAGKWQGWDLNSCSTTVIHGFIHCFYCLVLPAHHKGLWLHMMLQHPLSACAWLTSLVPEKTNASKTNQSTSSCSSFSSMEFAVPACPGVRVRRLEPESPGESDKGLAPADFRAQGEGDTMQTNSRPLARWFQEK